MNDIKCNIPYKEQLRDKQWLNIHYNSSHLIKVLLKKARKKGIIN